MHGRGTRSPAEKEVRDNSRTGGPAPPYGRSETTAVRQWTCSICMSIACRKNSPRVRQRSESNSKLDGCTAAFLDFEQQKNAPWLPQKGPACGSRRRGAKGGLNPVFFIFDPKTQKPNSDARPPLKSRESTLTGKCAMPAGFCCVLRFCVFLVLGVSKTAQNAHMPLPARAAL